jgi:CheY-like chemotaxis protein
METSALTSKRALIVEDNEGLAFTLSEYMVDYGVVSDFAKNGKEALDLASTNAYDFILMDIYMPIMNGFEATSKIKSLFPDVIIITVTSSSERLECERMRAAGAKDCILKPVNKEKLIQVISKNLS